jgi:hypothetical protein
MDRLNRMLQAAQGMGMGSAAPGGVSRPFASFMLCICCLWPSIHGRRQRLLSPLNTGHLWDRVSANYDG